MITNLWKTTKAMFTQLNPTARILTSLLLALAIPYQLDAAGPAPLNLLSNTNFVVLAETTITTTGGGSINGNVGLSPAPGTGILLTCAQVTGTIYVASAGGSSLACQVVDSGLLTQAVSDMMTSYTDAAGRTPVPTGPNLNPGAAFSTGYDMGGLTLAPGLYKFGSGQTAFINTDVTLSGSPSDVWIFQCGADLEVANGVHIILAGGANANNVFWQVATKAVLGTTAVFNGTILAGTSITMNTGSTMNGRALAQAQVTFNGTGAALPVTAPAIAVQQPLGTNLINGVSTNDFGLVAVGTNTNLTFTITNTGTANLTVSGITIDGADSSMFSVITNPATSLIPGGITTFTVRFAPVSTGLKTATLDIANNDIANNNNPFIIALTGTGTGTNTVPGIVVQQPVGTNLVNGVGTNNFGSVVVGATNSLTFTITNTGSANLTGLIITKDGTDAAMFSVTTNPTAPVSPGGATTFTVQFAPVSTGLKTAALHIANNDTNNNPFNITITGTATEGTLVGSTNVLVIATSPIMLNPQTGLFTNSVLVTNSGPNTIAAVRLLILLAPANADVQVYNASGSTTNCTPYVQYNFSLAPGATVDFTIEYYRASRRPIIPPPTYVVQELTNAVTLTVTNGVGVKIDKIVSSSGGMLIGFYTAPGRSYAVQYSSDMTNWLTADPFIIAPANYVQWFDQGPPKTQGPLPATRFYRVFELP
jgi:hypothetical protein